MIGAKRGLRNLGNGPQCWGWCVFRPHPQIPHIPIPWTRSSDPHQLPLDFARHPGLAGRGEHVDLAAHAELGQIDARLDGEAGIGQDAALVVGFQVVEMRAGAVDLLGDIVAGAMGEELAEAGGANDGAGRIVGLESADRAAGGKGCSTAAMAASRALRTVSKTSCSRSVGSRPTTPVQVMS